ncbi:MAG: hypothetical protein ACYC0L_06510 [Thermoleophilia bacterium]
MTRQVRAKITGGAGDEKVHFISASIGATLWIPWFLFSGPDCQPNDN